MSAKRLLVFFLFLLCIATVVSRASMPDCLSYETDGVKLTGKIKKMTFPGPPNYQSVKKGDQPEVAWVLHLTTPVCVNAGQDNEFDEAERNVTNIQLALEPEEYTKWRSLARAGAIVTVTGKLFHAHTGHHHTAVLMEVNNMTKQQR